jgi:hypothetical protein
MHMVCNNSGEEIQWTKCRSTRPSQEQTQDMASNHSLHVDTNQRMEVIQPKVENVTKSPVEDSHTRKTSQCRMHMPVYQ